MEFNDPNRRTVDPDSGHQYPSPSYAERPGTSRERGIRNTKNYDENIPLPTSRVGVNTNNNLELQPLSVLTGHNSIQPSSARAFSPEIYSSYGIPKLQSASASNVHVRTDSAYSATPPSLQIAPRPSVVHDGSYTRIDTSFSGNHRTHSLSDLPPSSHSAHLPPPFAEPVTNGNANIVEVDRDLTTRNFCVLALVIGWGVAFTSLALGIYIIRAGTIQAPFWLLDKDVAIGSVTFEWITLAPGRDNPYLASHRVFQVPEAVMIVTSLLLTFGLTIIFDSMNFIHATSLRWALWHEGKSHYNSNMRLFTSTKHHFPNQWPANVVSGLALIIAYGGIGLLTLDVYIVANYVKKGKHYTLDPDVSGPRYGLDFDAWGLIGVGIGTLLQAIVSTSCLVYKKTLIQTWSSNPLASARACLLQNDNKAVSNSNEIFENEPSQLEKSSSSSSKNLFRKRSESLSNISQSVSAFELCPSIPAPPRALSRPRTKQPSASASIPQTRRILTFLWISFAIVCTGTVIITFLAKKSESISESYVEQAGGRVDFLAFLQNFGQIYINYTNSPYTQPRAWLGLIIQSIALSVILGTLHLVEILTLLIRDERIWRKATTRDGAQPNSSTILLAASSWQCWVLWAFKSIIPWIFSVGFTCNGAVIFNLIPWAISAVLFLLLALFAEALIRWEPKGSQPSTFGNLSALMVLVDEWDYKRIFWGQKGEIVDGFGKAGTSGRRLADVEPGVLYTKLRAKLES